MSLVPDTEATTEPWMWSAAQLDELPLGQRVADKEGHVYTRTEAGWEWDLLHMGRPVVQPTRVMQPRYGPFRMVGAAASTPRKAAQQPDPADTLLMSRLIQRHLRDVYRIGHVDPLTIAQILTDEGFHR